MQFRGPEKSIQFTYDADGVSVRPSVGFREPSDPQEQCAVQVMNVESCTFAVWLDGFTYNRTGGDGVAFPLAIEWKLYLGVGGCMPDEDPPRGVAIYQTQEQMKTRSGRLFQINCIVHRTIWLCARILNDVGGNQFQANLRFMFWPLSGRPEAIVGTAIG